MKPIAVDEFFNFKFLSNITFSPEGGSACLTVTEIHKKKDEYRSYLTLYRDKKFIRLTSFGKERSFQYLVSPKLLLPLEVPQPSMGFTMRPWLADLLP